MITRTTERAPMADADTTGNDHADDPGVRKYHEPTYIGDGQGDAESAEPPREADDIPFDEAVEAEEHLRQPRV